MSRDRLAAALADRYRIERELGQGGMATVYLAEDLKHKRRVAVKVLKPELAAVLGAERFVQEITTTAALQHPHILPLFDSGEADGFLYYVMPFIDGETLRAKLDREAQLGVDEAVKLASEVAEALHYAHEHGVIHRDIKPENILLANGRPMVADFGIALAVSAAAGGRMTETGLSLGTPHYMSPEQATAEKEISARSDVYSLASVLFEMLTGQPPHLGGSAQQIIMKIITEQPAQVTALRKSVPPHVAAAVAKALEKLPADRFASAEKFAHALNDPGFATRSGTVAFAAGAGGVNRRWRASALALGGLAAVALGAALWLWLGARGTRQMLGVPVQFEVQLSEGVELSHSGTASYAAVSPDGNTVAFLGSEGATRRIYLRHLGDSEVRPVAGTESASMMFFSPDGRSLGFVASGQLSRVGLADGIITTISTASGVGFGGATWGANDVIVFSTGASSALWRVPATGGNPIAFLAPDTARGDVGFAFPHFLPDGKSLVFSINRGRGALPIAVSTLEGELTELDVTGVHAQYVAASGHLLFSGAGTLMGVRFDPDRKRILGAPAMLLEGVQVNRSGVGVWAASPTGTLVVDRGTTQSRLALVDREGTAQPLSDDARSFRLPRVSPDGQRILVQVTASVQEGLWLHDRRTGTLTRFTPPGPYSDGIWSRDGTRITFSGEGADQSVDIFWQSADGSGSIVPLVEGPGSQWSWTWTPDGRTLLYDEIHATRPTRVMAMTIDSAAPTPSAVLESASHLFRTPTLSPDGRWLAYTSNESGRIEVYVRPYPGSGGKQQVSLSGGDQPVWSRDGGELFYRDDRHLISASLRFDGGVSVTARTALFEDRFERSNATNYDALPNGRGFVMLEPQSGTRRLSVLVNWGTQLRARVGGEEQ